MRKHVLFVLMLTALASAALAQEAPAPRKMPRDPVNREALQGKTAPPPAREVQGPATILDGEKLRIGDYDLRLFGIVPPQLSASFGPQARSALDELTANQQTVTCAIRDRDREERLLATCHNANNADLALELLRRGLAVTARGSLTSSELGPAYLAAEQAAGAQKLGLWSVAVPAAAAVPETPKAEAAAQPAAPAHDKVADEKPPVIAAKNEPAPVVISPPAAKPMPVTKVTEAPVVISGEPGFLARYQLLVTGLVMLVTALGLFAAVTVQRLREKRAEMQAVAAALRGELMAMHAVCRARLRSSVNVEDKDIAWPRLRATLYQAYVGRLGWLGAELARHVASIYGQASDYAAYYAGNDETRAAAAPKRQALQNLAQHIDEALPRLAIIEHTGKPAVAAAKPLRPVAVVVPLSSQAVSSSPSSAPAAGVREARTPPTPAQLWSTVQKLARAPWVRTSPAAPTHDPVAEYTALIEEEMKHFSFMEEDEESEPAPEGSGGTWPPQKTHEAF